MELEQGSVIRSREAMEDIHFKNTTILITALTDDGATGFILNQPFGRSLNELAEFSHRKFFPLFTGGPVDREHLYFIHRQPLLISGGRLITDDVYFGGKFSEALDALNVGLLTTVDLKIFVGYCGWDAGELEAEIAEGSWKITALSADRIFQ